MSEISHIESEIMRLNDAIEDHPDVARLYYERGRLYWKCGRRGEAISDYEHAASLDPDSPAATALAQARDIMDFYNTDLYNP